MPKRKTWIDSDITVSIAAITILSVMVIVVQFFFDHLDNKYWLMEQRKQNRTAIHLVKKLVVESKYIKDSLMSFKYNRLGTDEVKNQFVEWDLSDKNIPSAYLSNFPERYDTEYSKSFLLTQNIHKILDIIELEGSAVAIMMVDKNGYVAFASMRLRSQIKGDPQKDKMSILHTIVPELIDTKQNTWMDYLIIREPVIIDNQEWGQYISLFQASDREKSKKELFNMNMLAMSIIGAAISILFPYIKKSRRWWSAWKR